MISSEALVGLPGYEVTGICESGGSVVVSARYVGDCCCPHCGSSRLRSRDLRKRRLRHSSFGERSCIFELETRKWLCRGCLKQFWQRFPGIMPKKRATEPFRVSVANRHLDGINRSRLGRREHIGSATIQRWVADISIKKISESKNAPCPRYLGIDEHFFSRKEGYATTFCDLGSKKVYDVVLGRSEASLEGYLSKLKDRDKVKVICIDLSGSYRSMIRKYFVNAKIVADRFHVIRLVNHHFLSCWKLIDPVGSKSRGLLSLMRRHPKNLKSLEQAQKLQRYLDENPAIKAIYDFKQEICELLLQTMCTAKRCRPLAKRLLHITEDLLNSPFEPMATLGQTFASWQEEIARMWRFTKNNGITEGFHNKMETISRQAYGYRNFENYRMRVKVLCG